MRHLVGYSRNNIPIYVDLIHSSAVKNIAREPHLLTLAKEALRRSALDGLRVILECDMGHAIGYDFVIETIDEDAVFYARLVRDTTYTRFTRKGSPLATSYLTIIMELDEDGASYKLHDIWIGRYRPPQPGSIEEDANSDAYWKQHAVIFQNHPVQTSTLTKTCPY